MADGVGVFPTEAMTASKEKPMIKIKTNIKAGGLKSTNHNQGLRVRTSVKAGGLKTNNHNQRRG